MTARSRCDKALLASYFTMIVASLTAVSVAPPAAGAMIMVPIGDNREALSLAITRGGAIMGTGPGGTTIIRGERAQLFWPLLYHGVLTFAAPAALCGELTA